MLTQEDTSGFYQLTITIPISVATEKGTSKDVLSPNFQLSGHVCCITLRLHMELRPLVNKCLGQLSVTITNISPTHLRRGERVHLASQFWNPSPQ